MVIREIRDCAGRNIHCHRPVLVMLLELGANWERTSDQMGDFSDRLVAAMPTLVEHYCSRGRKGGFLERLAEGTLLGHVVEHVWLELMNLAGMPVTYGKTRSTEIPGRYEVICEYTCREAAEQAARLAVQLVQSLLAGGEGGVESMIRDIRATAAKYQLGPSTGAIVEACRRRGIPVMRLNSGSLLQLGYGVNQKRVQATLTQQTSCVAVDVAGDKSLCKTLLADAGVPVPQGVTVTMADEAWQFAGELGRPVVIKPHNGNQGKGVSLNLTSTAEVVNAFALASQFSDRVVVEEHIRGRQYRLLVVDGKMVAAAERLPTMVIGDGYHSISQLVEMENQNPLRGEEHEKPLTKIVIDPVVLLVLAKQGFTTNQVPAPGQVVLLRENANLSTGGTAVDVTDLVHPANAEVAVRAARAVGLDVAGVDVVTPDITVPLETTGGAVIEVNAAPGIRMHHFPSQGQPRDAAGAIVDYLFPAGHDGRIPLVTVTGTNGKTTTTRLLAAMLKGCGYRVGCTTTDGVYIDGKLVAEGDTTGPWSARLVLRDPTVEAAVLETARGGLVRAGLAFDWADVAVVTNLSEDHLGQDGIETMEDLWHVKSLLVEAVRREGTVVLNADDPLVVAMAARARCPVIYFSLKNNNTVVRRHLGAGGTALFISHGYVVVAEGQQVTRLAPVKRMPMTWRGLATHNVANGLAAAAAACGLRLPTSVIQGVLMSFGADPADNPGRLVHREVGGIRVVLDYGHNPDGITATLQAVRATNPRRLLGVIGVPGDRADALIKKSGLAAARLCKQMWIKEDRDLRGRQPGEVAALLLEGALAGGLTPAAIYVELDEVTAFQKALAEARSGDAVVVFFEKFTPVWQALSEFSAVVSVAMRAVAAVE